MTIVGGRYRLTREPLHGATESQSADEEHLKAVTEAEKGESGPIA